MVECDLRPLTAGQFLVRNAYMSVNPYTRGRMTNRAFYNEPFRINAALDGSNVGVVVEFKDANFVPGTTVSHFSGWCEHAIIDASTAKAVDAVAFPIQAHLIDADDGPILNVEKGVKSIEQGTATQFWCAVSPQLERPGGVYCENIEIAQIAINRTGDGSDLRATTAQTSVQSLRVNRVAAPWLCAPTERMLSIQLSGSSNSSTRVRACDAAPAIWWLHPRFQFGPDLRTEGGVPDPAEQSGNRPKQYLK